MRTELKPRKLFLKNVEKTSKDKKVISTKIFPSQFETILIKKRRAQISLLNIKKERKEN